LSAVGFVADVCKFNAPGVEFADSLRSGVVLVAVGVLLLLAGR